MTAHTRLLIFVDLVRSKLGGKPDAVRLGKNARQPECHFTPEASHFAFLLRDFLRSGCEKSVPCIMVPASLPTAWPILGSFSLPSVFSWTATSQPRSSDRRRECMRPDPRANVHRWAETKAIPRRYSVLAASLSMTAVSATRKQLVVTPLGRFCAPQRCASS